MIYQTTIIIIIIIIITVIIRVPQNKDISLQLYQKLDLHFRLSAFVVRPEVMSVQCQSRRLLMIDTQQRT